MQICLISDTHGRHGEVTIPPSDVLIHCGDATRNEGRADLRHFLQWLDAQPAYHKIFVAGNHDWAFEKRSELAQAMVEEVAPSVTYLQDSGVEIDGFKFWGSPVSPRFLDWAFNRDRGEDIKRHWDLIPNDTDVVLTHGPQYGILDGAGEMVVAGTTSGIEHVGCQDLLSAIARIRPRLHACGHIHASYGRYDLIHPDGSNTCCVNASCCNESYSPVNKPIVICL